MNEVNHQALNEDHKTYTLSEAFKDAFKPPSEEKLYLAHFQRDFWSLETFSALISGISPERHEKMLEATEATFFETFTSLDIKKFSEVTKIRRKFLDHLDEIFLTERVHVSNGNFYMTPWKFIKWISINDIPMRRQFFDALPLYLMEIYLEFQPGNAPLRTQSKRSRAYHEAFYLKNAKEIMNKSSPRLSFERIYSHPRMQNVLRQIRSFGHSYKKRTITNSWLPKLEKRKRGRPKKNPPQNS